MKGMWGISCCVPMNLTHTGNVFWLFYFPLKYYNRLDLLKYWNQDYENSEECNLSCQAGIKSISIMCNGDVYGCDLMIGIDEFKAGNILRNTIDDIWNNSTAFNKELLIN